MTYRVGGVDDGTRTHDGRDHNPGLYQLSYVHHRLRQEPSRFNGLRSSIPCGKPLMILKSQSSRQAWKACGLPLPLAGRRSIYERLAMGIGWERKNPGYSWAGSAFAEKNAPAPYRQPRRPRDHPAARHSEAAIQLRAREARVMGRHDRQCPRHRPVPSRIPQSWGRLKSLARARVPTNRCAVGQYRCRSARDLVLGVHPLVSLEFAPAHAPPLEPGHGPYHAWDPAFRRRDCQSPFPIHPQPEQARVRARKHQGQTPTQEQNTKGRKPSVG